jgi:RNA polymerase sigma-70 factor, ECF subfamily
VVAVRAAIDLQRARGGERRVNLDEERLVQPLESTPELELLKTRYLPEVKSAFGDAMRALSSEDRNLLRLHLVENLTLDEIGQLFRVNRSTVFRWIAATRERLYDDARSRLRERLGLSAAEFDSLTQLVRSRLDLSISQVLVRESPRES